MKLFPGADVTVGGHSAPDRLFYLEDELGSRPDVSGTDEFRFRAYREFTETDGGIRRTELFNITGTGATANGEFTIPFTELETSFPPGSYPCELCWWASGTVTEPPTERYPGLYTVTRRLKSP